MLLYLMEKTYSHDARTAARLSYTLCSQVDPEVGMPARYRRERECIEYLKRRNAMTLKDYVTLGRSGLRVSPLCLGAMTFGTEWGFGADEKGVRALFDS
jgi:hypothetical protein